MPTSVRPSATSLLLLTLGHGGESGIFHWALGCSGPGRRTYTTTLAFLCHTFVCPGSSAGAEQGPRVRGLWRLSRGRHSVTRCYVVTLCHVTRPGAVCCSSHRRARTADPGLLAAAAGPAQLLRAARPHACSGLLTACMHNC